MCARAKTGSLEPYHAWAGGHLTLQFNPSKLLVLALTISFNKRSSGYTEILHWFLGTRIKVLTSTQPISTSQMSRKFLQLLLSFRILQLVPCNRDAGTLSLPYYFWQGPRKNYLHLGSTMVIVHGSNGPIYITIIFWHFDISDHISSPLAHWPWSRIIIGWSGSKSTASLWAFPETDPQNCGFNAQNCLKMFKFGWFGVSLF